MSGSGEDHLEALGVVGVDVAARMLKQGELVAFPTETVYGLGADALSEAAVERVFALKGRPSTNPLIVHVDSVNMARTVCAHWGERCDKLADVFWPGPLTLVLKKAERVPSVVTAGGDTVAVRVPGHTVARELIATFDGPMVGPSANTSGSISPTTAQHVIDDFEADIQAGKLRVVDGGACEAGIESTVVSLADDEPLVLRQGVVTPAQIETVLGEKVRVPRHALVEGGEAMPSPGMLTKHYAPSTPAQLVRMGDVVERAMHQPDCVLMVFSDEANNALKAAGELADSARVMRLPGDAAAYAAQLYAALREADAIGARAIVIEQPEAEGPVWDAIRDRLQRACAEDPLV